MSEIKYNIGFFFNSIKNFDVKTTVNFANFVAEHCNAIYTKFGYNTIIDGKKVAKDYKYITKNLEKLMAIDSPITSLSFDSLNEKKSHIDTNITFIISMVSIYDSNYPTTINITLDPVILGKEFNRTYLIKFLEQIDICDFDLEYGVAFPMEKKKLPIYFLTGMQTPEMDEEEREIANALALHKREYRNKIWDIFQHNIIKKELLTGTMLNSIMAIVGQNNIFEVGNKYIISLPLECEDYIDNKAKLNRYRNGLRKIFAKENMIMWGNG